MSEEAVPGGAAEQAPAPRGRRRLHDRPRRQTVRPAGQGKQRKK